MPGGTLDLRLARELATPRLQAKVSDLEFAHAVLLLDCEPLVDAPILDLRLRKGVRRHEMKLERASGADLRGAARDGRWLAQAGEELVILWGERFARRRREAASACGHCSTSPASSRSPRPTAPGCWKSRRRATAADCASAACCPTPAPGLSRQPSGAGLDTPAIAAALGAGELSALYLLEVDPLSESDPFAATFATSADGSRGRARWSARARSSRTRHCSREGVAEHANVIFPAGSYAEKEGTVTHPDGRLQRVRQAVAQAGTTRPGWR